MRAKVRRFLVVLGRATIGACAAAGSMPRGPSLASCNKAWFRADVGIRGDRIVAVARLDEASAERIIDAEGLVVAPGFIDLHTHSDMPLLEDGDPQSQSAGGRDTRCSRRELDGGAPGRPPARHEHTAGRRSWSIGRHSPSTSTAWRKVDLHERHLPSLGHADPGNRQGRGATPIRA